MSRRTTPPFRADHVGSLLRPPRLHQAREDFAAGRITAADLRAVEDEEIVKAIRMQEEVGLQSATDGEFRRATWHMDFIYQLGGISEAPGHLAVQFTNPSGTIEWTPAALHVGSKVRLDHTIFGEDFTFVRDHVTTAVPKQTIPSPNMVHYRGGPAMLDPAVYPGHRGVLGRPGRRLRRRGAAARRAGLHLPAVRRHQPGLPQRPRPAGRRSAGAARTPSTCTCATSTRSTRR